MILLSTIDYLSAVASAKADQLSTLCNVRSDLSGGRDLSWGPALPTLLSVRIECAPLGGSGARRLTAQLLVYLPAGLGFRTDSQAIALGGPLLFRSRDDRNVPVNSQIKTLRRGPFGIHPATHFRVRNLGLDHVGDVFRPGVLDDVHHIRL